MSLTLAEYAAAKKLDAALLTSWGLTEHHDGRGTYVRMPYRNELGVEVAVRMRLSLDGAERFRWRSGAKPCLYGLDRLAAARAKGFIVLVEGESDCQTLAQAGVPALGVPGAGLWNEARDARHFDGIEKIYVVIEGDAGGDAVTRWLAKSAIRERSLLVRFSGEVKDPSALYLADPAAFAEAFAARLAAAEPWAAIEAARAGMEETHAFALARELIETPDILARFRATLAHAGLVGEDRNASVLYLALTSRLLPKPVSIAYKGPSSGGKSYAVERVLAHFPHDARVAITSMSEKALIFMDDDLRHKHLVIAEAEGAGGEFQEYLIRSLLSEGRLEHRMAEKAEGAIVGRHVVKEGPTGLIITTTRVSLHPENETRLISLSANDTRADARGAGSGRHAPGGGAGRRGLARAADVALVRRAARRGALCAGAVVARLGSRDPDAARFRAGALARRGACAAAPGKPRARRARLDRRHARRLCGGARAYIRRGVGGRGGSRARACARGGGGRARDRRRQREGGHGGCGRDAAWRRQEHSIEAVPGCEDRGLSRQRTDTAWARGALSVGRGAAHRHAGAAHGRNARARARRTRACIHARQGEGGRGTVSPRNWVPCRLTPPRQRGG